MLIFNRPCVLAALVLGMGLGAGAQDELKKSGQEKTSVEKTSYPFEGQVKVDRLNVRLFLGTDKEGTIVTTLAQGSKVVVMGEKDDWYHILPPKGCFCWIATSKVKKDSDSEGTVLLNDTPVRIDSRQNAEKLAGLNEGEKIQILKEHMGWYQIQAPSAVKYFAKRKYIEFTGEAVLPANATKKTEPADAKNGDATANALMNEAEALFDEILKKLAADPKNIQDSYIPAIELYVKAKELASSADLRNKADKKAADARHLEAARQNAVKALANLPVKAEPVKETPKFAFMGYVDTVGALWNRPGAHKLIMADRTVCFVKCNDEAMRIKFNGLYQRYVGVRGKVTRDPEGWTGYSVIEVESVEEVLKKD